MVAWELCAGLASLALGSFGIPLQMANDKLSPFAVTILYGSVLILQGLFLQSHITDKHNSPYQWNFQLTREWGWAFLSVLIQCIGVQSLIFGLSQDNVILSLFFAIVSTQTLWSTFLGLLFLGEWKRVIVWKIIVGTVSIVGGALLMTQGIKSQDEPASPSMSLTRFQFEHHGTFSEDV